MGSFDFTGDKFEFELLISAKMCFNVHVVAIIVTNKFELLLDESVKKVAGQSLLLDYP